MKKTSADPIAQLMQEHNEALVQLKLLNKAVHAFSQDGYSTRHFNQINAALRFIEEEVSVHNYKEEAALFPVLERYVEGPTRVMRNDHKKLKKGFKQLTDAVQDIQKHRDSFSAIKRLSTVSKSVVQLFVNHIHKENYILFPLVQQFLTKDELREIAKKML
ncbi:MAG: hemerythrin domain-containing protein [Ignavibacteria bacterium]|nr:hemerythrin domain-containing protein [Ignavibacteria bacterium]